MGTHVAAIMITIFAYRYARKHADNPAFSFGTGKVGVLGGFASAVALAVVALMMFVESLQRLASPQLIQLDAAIAVAALGLAVNIVSALLLKDHHSHRHQSVDHSYQETSKDHHDQNLYAAYMHVLADALTSLLAIFALLSAKYFGWYALDPVMGIVGALIITYWAIGLIRQSSPILLDGGMSDYYQELITKAIENDSDNRITDLHIWKISGHDYAAIISLVTHHPRSTDYYKSLLADFHWLSHLTIEVQRCEDSHMTEPGIE
jgi:cation diffusion facilitator family transporter